MQALTLGFVRFARRRFTAIVLAIAIVQSLALLVLRPGALSVDEVTYHAMTRGLSHGTFAIENGWDLTTSTELEGPLMRGIDGRLVSQYPEGFALICAPLYRVLGVGAMFVVNCLSFFATVLLCRALALEVLKKRGAAFLAAIVFACATFAWEYGAAIWPHAFGTLLTTAALHQVIRSARDASTRRMQLRLLGAGLLAGVATTLRLDAAFILPALLLVPALVPSLTRSRSLLSALFVLLGTAPAIAFLSLVNHAKFGRWLPFYYGPWQPSDGNSGVAQYVPLAALAIVGLVAAHAAAPHVGRIRRVHVMAALACVALALIVPDARAAAQRLADGLWMLVVDLRIRDPNWVEAALTRSPRGAMIYVEAFKTSLLQSCPFLPAIAISLGARGGDPALRRRKLAVFAPVAVYVTVYAWFRWHGGLSVNLRYFVPALPFLAILTADGLVRLARRCAPVLRASRVTDLIALAGIALYIGALTMLHLPSAAWSVREVFYLDVPLVLGAILAIAIAVTLAARKRRPRVRAWSAAIAFCLAVVALVWGGLTEITYDAIAVMRVRGRGHLVAARARELIPAGSVVVADYPDPVAGLIDDGDVIANGSRDDFADTQRLVAAASCRGRKSFAVMRRGAWARLSARFDPDAISAVVLRDADHPDLVIAELRPTGAGACR